MRLLSSLLIPCVCVLTTPVAGASDAVTPQTITKVADQLAPSMVQVEITYQYDQGDLPSRAWTDYGAYDRTALHSSWYVDYEDLIGEERPLLLGGYLVDEDMVVINDFDVHPRFVKNIKARFNDVCVDAELDTLLRDQNAALLRLASPLPGATPLVFDAEAPGPYLQMLYFHAGGEWMMAGRAFSPTTTIGEDDAPLLRTEGGYLYVDASGTPVGFSATGVLDLDGAWKGDPQEHPGFTKQEWSDVLERVTTASRNTVLHVKLNFRSPRKGGGERYYYGDDHSGVTEWQGHGVLVDDRHVLVLVKFKTKQTARLEKMTVLLEDGRTIEGSFLGSLKDYGAMVIELAEPVEGAAPWCVEDPKSLRFDLLAHAEIAIHGENRTDYHKRARISGVATGWQGNIYPQYASTTERHGGYYYGSSGEDLIALNFLFTRDGRLAALPVARRKKATVDEGWDSGPIMTSMAQLAPILSDPTSYFDPDNVPMSEEEENRLAWLGVELQPMSPDLARLHNISHLTQGGSIGGIVTHIYPGSPAEKIDLQLGDFLFRLHVEDHPKPLELQFSDFMSMYGSDFPWEFYDEMPGEYFDQMPTPWSSAENSLNTSLTELGFGTNYTAEIWRDGETIMLESTVEEGPKHYQAAARKKLDTIGVTVRNLTYEVRRYFQIAEDEPGIILSSIEPGEKGAVAGLRPYELIIEVNDQPMRTIEDFIAIVEQGGELEMFIKRMLEGRRIRIKVDPAEPEADEDAADTTEEEPEEAP
jgi:serine protease Do